MTRAILASLGLAALAVSPAMALDCQRASTSSEKAICADSTALAADSDLGKAFAALHAALDPKAKTQLGAAEVAWLALCLKQVRDEKSAREGSADDDSGAPKTLAESVAEATGDLKA